MKIFSGYIFTSQDFITTNNAGDVMQCVIGNIFINQRNMNELLFPRSHFPDTEALVLEMSTKLWKAQQKRAFSEALPWIISDPPEWVEPKTEYLSSNKHGTKYVPERMLFGAFDPEQNIFHIHETDVVLPGADILIRRTYSRIDRYHGMTPEEATKYGFAAFQKIPINDHTSEKGVEYWILKHPVL